MSKRKQIVCLGFPKWEGDYMKSTVSLMSELAKTHEVLYVDYPYTYKDILYRMIGREKTASIPNLLGWQSRLRSRVLTRGQTIHLLSLPPFLPANWLSSAEAYDRLLAINSRNALRVIRKALKSLQFEKPIVVNAFNPALGNALQGQLAEELLVYYCYDEISAAQWIGKHGTRHENKFLAQVDLTIVSSKGLLQTKAPKTANCVLVKNGVSLDLFKGDIPRSSQGRPRIGYLGSLDERLDVSLLEYLIKSFPVWEFQFVGRIVLPDLGRSTPTFSECSYLWPQACRGVGSSGSSL